MCALIAVLCSVSAVAINCTTQLQLELPLNSHRHRYQCHYCKGYGHICFACLAQALNWLWHILWWGSKQGSLAAIPQVGCMTPWSALDGPQETHARHRLPIPSLAEEPLELLRWISGDTCGVRTPDSEFAKSFELLP